MNEPRPPVIERRSEEYEGFGHGDDGADDLRLAVRVHALDAAAPLVEIADHVAHLSSGQVTSMRMMGWSGVGLASLKDAWKALEPAISNERESLSTS